MRRFVQVVVNRDAVLDEEAEDREPVLGEVRDRYHEQRARHVTHQGVMALHVRLLGRQVDAFVGELAQALAVALEHELRCHILHGRVEERAGVARGKEVCAGIVGEEELSGVEARRRRKGGPGRAGE
jgi:hypothetical protein